MHECLGLFNSLSSQNGPECHLLKYLNELGYIPELIILNTLTYSSLYFVMV